ncbi:MAG: alkaline phosphatase family protein [Thermoplasmata archaeon]|nr:alkaline phosphatase family protein [Thermoplasmata archaeon]
MSGSDGILDAHRDAEADALAKPQGRLGVPCPAYGGRSLPNLSATLLSASGVEGGPGPPLVPPLDQELDPFQGRRSEGPVVQFLIDGLGWSGFTRWARHARFGRGRRWGAAARPITSVFPTTTTAALASLSTGVPPGRHGLIGYRQFLPRYGVVADMLKMSPLGIATPDLLVGPAWRPEHISGSPTLFRRGLDACALTRDRFQGTGLTRLLYDGAEFVGYATGTDFAHELLRLLERDHPPTIFAYWDELDTIQHLKGTEPGLPELELDRLVHLLEYVADRLPPAKRAATTLLVSGDHGQVPASLASRIEIEQEPAIADELLHPLAGDRRAGFFAARPGRTPALREALERRLPEGSRVIPMEDAVDAGLFGPAPYHPEIRERLGDLLALVPSPSSLTYLLPGMAKPSRFLVGAHGGLEPNELIVPLIAAPLESFRTEGAERIPQR